MHSFSSLVVLCLVAHVTAIFNTLDVPSFSLGNDGLGSFLWNGCFTAIWPALHFVMSGYQYDRLVSENGIMQLAQAGIYRGAEAIQEYGSFLSATSPFIEEHTNGNIRVQYMGPDANGFCVFDVGFDWYHRHDGTTSAYAAEYNYPIMFKATFSKWGRADNINVYFAPGFFEQVFTRILDSDNTRRTICEIYNTNCAQIVTETPVDCESAVAGLPVFEAPAFWIDGNSQGCRALHGAFAILQPNRHCPHISFAGQADPDGKVNCQTSLGVSPEDLFDDNDFAFWNDYCARFGFDPDFGFREIGA